MTDAEIQEIKERLERLERYWIPMLTAAIRELGGAAIVGSSGFMALCAAYDAFPEDVKASMREDPS